MHDARKKIHSYWARTDREDAVVQPEPQTYAQASTAEHLGLAPPDPIDDATRTMTTDDPAHGAPRLLFWIYEPDGLDADSTLVAVTKKTDRYVHYIDARGHQERIGRHRLKALLKGPRCDWFAPRTWEERALLEGVAEHSLTPASGVQQALEMRSGERRYADLQVDVKDAEAGVRA